MEVLRRMQEARDEAECRAMEARAKLEHLEAILAESDAYSDFDMNYDSLIPPPEYYGFSSGADPYNEIDRVLRFADADSEFSDIPPLLEPAEDLGGMDGISSVPEDATSKGKGRQVEDEAGQAVAEGRALDKGKGKSRDKGKGKARASPYPDSRERLHLRTSLSGLGLLSLFPSYLMNAGGCTDDAMPDLLPGLRGHPNPFPADHFSGDPSGCGVPHHD
jgi:hypothetical protein